MSALTSFFYLWLPRLRTIKPSFSVDVGGDRKPIQCPMVDQVERVSTMWGCYAPCFANLSTLSFPTIGVVTPFWRLGNGFSEMKVEGKEEPIG